MAAYNRIRYVVDAPIERADKKSARLCSNSSQENDSVRQARFERDQCIDEIVAAAKAQAYVAIHYLIEKGNVQEAKKRTKRALERVTDDKEAVHLICITAADLQRLPTLTLPLCRAAREHAHETLDVLIPRCRRTYEVKKAIDALVDEDHGAGVKNIYCAPALARSLGALVRAEWVRATLRAAIERGRSSVAMAIADLYGSGDRLSGKPDGRDNDRHGSDMDVSPGVPNGAFTDYP